MATKLDNILASTRERVASSKRVADLAALTAAAERHQPRGFKKALRAASRNGIAVIAELKKASPSKGLIRQDFRVKELAADLEKAGAAALSVLTDEPFFQGSLENLEKASDSTRLPCLRKDFIVDDFQLLEARAHRADAVLLIVAALSQRELVELSRRAAELQVDVLCEVHDGAELQRALDAECQMIGVNNRDLHTFRVDLNTSLELAELMPSDVLKVAESGIDSGEDIAKLREAGFDAFLIGESLMRAEHPGNALQELMANAQAALRDGEVDFAMTWVKICGITNLVDANMSIAAGADALGFIFATSPRQIEVAQAAEIAAAIGNQVEKIGVFVNQAPEVVMNIAEQVGLTGVQLHGDEPAMFMPKLRRLLGNRKIIKTLHAKDLMDGFGQDRQLGDYLGSARIIDAILLDSGSREQRGGTGAAFAWEGALPIAQSVESVMPLIVAGGLTAENVQDAIRLFKPWGVDVVSGVESQPGLKDESKLQSFVASVRAVSDRVHTR